MRISVCYAINKLNKQANDIGDRKISQFVNADRQIIDLFATDKSQYLTHPRQYNYNI